LWVGVGIACLVTKLAADRLGVQAKADLYLVGQGPEQNN
jgi:hypothetical protein